MGSILIKCSSFKRTHSCQWQKNRVWDGHAYTAVFKMGNKALLQTRGNSAQHHVAGWMGVGVGRRGVSMWMAESLRCSPETVTTSFIGCTPTQNKKFKKTQMRFCNAPKGHTEPGSNLCSPTRSLIEHMPPSAAVTVCLPAYACSSLPASQDTPDTLFLTASLLTTTTRASSQHSQQLTLLLHGSWIYLPKTNTHHDEKAQDCVSHQQPRLVLGPRSALEGSL